MQYKLNHNEYSDLKELQGRLDEMKDDIQCVVSGVNFESTPTVGFGMAQQPSLSDYADGVDTMQFLTTLQ